MDNSIALAKPLRVWREATQSTRRIRTGSETQRLLARLESPRRRFKSKISARKLGYEDSKLELLRNDLLDIARSEEVTAISLKGGATKYVIEGLLNGPAGTPALFKTVWRTSREDARPQFITGYPSRRRKK